VNNILTIKLLFLTLFIISHTIQCYYAYFLLFIVNYKSPHSLNSYYFSVRVERCNPWPHVVNRHISISQLLSLWRHSRYDLCARSPRSHYDVIFIVTSFAIELATPTVTDVRTDTLPRLIYI